MVAETTTLDAAVVPPPQGEERPNFSPSRSTGARLLELLAERADAKPDSEQAWRSARRFASAPADTLEEALAHIARVAPQVGLQAAPSRVTLQEIVEVAADEGRALLVPIAEGDHAAWFVPLRRVGNRVRGAWLSPYGESVRTLSIAALERLILDDETPALILESRFPLDALVRPADKQKDPVTRAWARLWRFVRLERSDLRLVLGYAVAIGVLSLITPVAVQALVNSIALTTLVQNLIVLSLALLGGLVLSAVLRGLRIYVVEVLARRIFVRVAADYARRIPAIDPRSRDGADLPEMTLHFFDVLTLQKSGAHLLLDALGLVLQTVMGAILLALYHPHLMVFDLLLILMLAIVLVGFFRRGTRTALDESKRKYHVASWLQQLANNPAAFSSHSTSRLAVQRGDRLSHAYLRARRAHFKVLLRLYIGSLALQVLAPVFLLVIGGMLVIDNELTLGQLVAAELVVSAISLGFGKLGGYTEKLLDVVAGMEKLAKLVELPRRQPSTEQLTDRTGPASVRISGPRCGTVDIPAGARASLEGTPERVRRVFAALRGADGAELRTVEVDGKPVDGTELEVLGDAVWWIGQPRFFRGTILDYLSLGPRPVDPHEARLAMARACLDLDDLGDGLDTELTPTGSPLSPGQRRRLMLARALLHEPRVLFVDGALDDLELAPERRDRVIGAILSPSAPWTTLVRSGDPNVLAHCGDRFTLEDGR